MHICIDNNCFSKLATFATHWAFRDTTLGGYLLEGNSPAKFFWGSGTNQVSLQSNGTPCQIPELNVNANSTDDISSSLSSGTVFTIDLRAGLITN